jgi:hypothetical protein
MICLNRGGKGFSIQNADDPRVVKYACVGPSAKRAGVGVWPLHHAIRKMDIEQQHILLRYMTDVIELIKDWMPPAATNHLQKAMRLIFLECMVAGCQRKYLCLIATTWNVWLRLGRQKRRYSITQEMVNFPCESEPDRKYVNDSMGALGFKFMCLALTETAQERMLHRRKRVPRKSSMLRATNRLLVMP